MARHKSSRSCVQLYWDQRNLVVEQTTRWTMVAQQISFSFSFLWISPASLGPVLTWHSAPTVQHHCLTLTKRSHGGLDQEQQWHLPLSSIHNLDQMDMDSRTQLVCNGHGRHRSADNDWGHLNIHGLGKRWDLGCFQETSCWHWSSQLVDMVAMTQAWTGHLVGKQFGLNNTKLCRVQGALDVSAFELVSA